MVSFEGANKKKPIIKFNTVGKTLLFLMPLQNKR